MKYQEAVESGLPFNRLKYKDGWYRVDQRGYTVHVRDLSIRNPEFNEFDKNCDDWVVYLSDHDALVKYKVILDGTLRTLADVVHMYMQSENLDTAIFLFTSVKRGKMHDVFGDTRRG